MKHDCVGGLQSLDCRLRLTPNFHMIVGEGLFKKAVRQGRKLRGGRGVLGGTLSHPSNENPAGGIFQQSQDGTHDPASGRKARPSSTRHPYRQPRTLTPKNQPLFLYLLALIGIGAGLFSADPVTGQPSMVNGIQPLIQLEGQPPHRLIPKNIRPLLLPHEQEQFLRDLEGAPPDWPSLQNRDHTEQRERLFQLNRERDKTRLGHKDILRQPIAFLWSGILRQYLPDYEGFSVALGPELTSTSWGIVRFKPMGLPDYLVAIPGPNSSGPLLLRQENGEQIEIGVIFFGTLTTDESLIYDFSHDDKENNGMILPVVHIEGVRYFLPTP